MASPDPRILTLGSVRSALAFTRTGGGNWTQWDRFLTLDGKPAYHIGNICNTCEFFYQRLEGATRSLSAEQLAATLAAGPPPMERAWLEMVGALLPFGEYVPFYTQTPLKLVTPGGLGDYYAEEQVATWGVNAFWGFAARPTDGILPRTRAAAFTVEVRQPRPLRVRRTDVPARVAGRGLGGRIPRAVAR